MLRVFQLLIFKEGCQRFFFLNKEEQENKLSDLLCYELFDFYTFQWEWNNLVDIEAVAYKLLSS